VHTHRHHDHDHHHGHSHQHGQDHQLGSSPAGSVLLDLGPDTGVLVIHTTEREHLLEIEISPGTDPAAPRTHAAVRERILPDRILHAAVYPGLPAGTYTVWRDATTPHGTTTIAPASVADYVYAQRRVVYA
jgi:hypothetical protein